MITKEQAISYMQERIGWSEANGKAYSIIDLYNSQSVLPRGYRLQYSDEWCAATISTIGIHYGLDSSEWATECSCYYYLENAKKIGWQVIDKSDMQAGDIVVYDWKSAGTYYDHIGIVESVDGSNISVLEGNKSEKVDRRVFAHQDSTYQCIYACIRPSYTEEKEKTQKGNDDMKLIFSYEGAGGIWLQHGIFYSVFNHPDELEYTQQAHRAAYGEDIPTHVFANEAEWVRYTAALVEVKK